MRFATSEKMLRSVLRNTRSTRLVTSRRSQTSNGQTTPTSGSGKAAKFVIGTVTVAGAATLGYAVVDPSFAKTLKDTAPFLEPVLDALGCDTSGGTPQVASLPPSQPKTTPSDQSLLRKPKPIDSTMQVEPAKKAVKTAEPLKSGSVVTGASSATLKESKESEVLHQKQNFILEQTLRDSAATATRSATDAIAELDALAATTSQYATKLMEALEYGIDGGDHQLWREVNDAKGVYATLQKKSDTKSSEAHKALQRLDDAIRKGRSDETTKDNINISQAEHTLNKLREKFDTATSNANKAREKADFAQQLNKSIEESKQRLIEEVNAVLPAGKSFSDSKNLTAEDLGMLVHHAHKKIGSLQKELSHMQLSDSEKARYYRQQLSDLDKEIKRQKNDIAKTVEERLSKEREKFEEELQYQLRRQVGVHTEHLKEALEDQRAEMTRHHQLELEKCREEERAVQVNRLTDAVGMLQKMEDHLHARKLLDEAAKQAKALWLSCASLKHVLTQGRSDKTDLPQSIAGEITQLKEVSESSEFVKAVLSAIPDEALKRGVYPEIALKKRFHRVETACQRVALMEDQNGGGPGRHLLSYLMSLFIIYPKPVPQEELDKEQKVNPLMWDTFDILSRIRASLQREDLEQALRYAHQLKGEPRRVAKDWIHEVRLLLETKQATDVLMAYAAATAAEDLSK